MHYRYPHNPMADEPKNEDEANLGSRAGAGAWLEFKATMFAMGVVSRLPRFVQKALISGLARLAMRLDKRHSHAARAFISQALGPAAAKEDWRIHRAYVHLFQMSVDSHAFDRKVPADQVLEHYDIECLPEVQAAFDSDRGAILVSCHVGDWEAGAAVMPYLGMSPSYVVARPPKNRYLSQHLLEVRRRKNVTVLPRRGSMLQVGSVLKEGGWIAMLLDQRSSGKSVLAPFFGRPTTCERSVAVLIKRMGMPIVFVGCYITDRPFYYDMVFPCIIQAEELADKSVEEIITRINREQEKLILRHPEQYFWLHDRYRDAPPLETAGEAPASPSLDPTS
jgi:KDO2-lipid IV(A) lauroyltransferase